MLIALHLEEHPERLRRIERHAAWLGLPLQIFPGVTGPTKRIGIARSMRLAAASAVTEGWGLDIVFMQDDIRFPSKVPEATHPLTVYGHRYEGPQHNGHVSPWAFAANPDMWAQLLDVFEEDLGSDQPHVCEAWRPIVDEQGLVLNIVGSPTVPRG